MPVYELTLELPELTDEEEDAVVDATDGVVATHFGVTTVTVDAEAEDYLSAVRESIRALTVAGVRPHRLLPDLVSRSEIAERAEVTRQAVSNWVNGTRQAGTFPPPFVLAGGGMWLWAEVATVLRARGLDIDGDLSYPTREQIIIGCAMTLHSEPLLQALATGRSKWIYATHGKPVEPIAVAAPSNVQLGFSLAA